MRKFKAVLVALAMVLALGVGAGAGAKPVAASHFTPTTQDVAAIAATPCGTQCYTGNLAGRPFSGSADGNQPIPPQSCHGLAYGRFNGSLVLFTAWHCRPVGGGTVIAPNGVVLGVWTNWNIGGLPTNPPTPGGRWNNDDLTFIILYTGNAPAAKNVIYSNANGASFTVTRMPPLSIACANYPQNTTIDQLFQYDTLTTYGPNVGVTLAPYGNPCEIETTVPKHLPTSWIDSGTPFILSGYSNTLFGIGTAVTPDYAHLIVTPFYEGINAFNAIAVNAGGSGAWLCQTATC